LSIEQWDARYRAGEQAFETPSPLVTRFVAGLRPGIALDLACGPGRHALYLARLGWKVIAVDVSAVAIEKLTERACKDRLEIDARTQDLETQPLEIPVGTYDLILDCYYLQRDLFPKIRAGLRSGGLLIAIVHLADPGEPAGTPTRAVSGELRSCFEHWEILHDYEGVPSEEFHNRPVAELAVRKP
jgi:tellurite methyltransferase